MFRRAPLYVAVVGALLVGGATTGTTRASWTGQANLQAAAVSSGTMGLGASASPTSVTVERGSSATTRVTVTDTSSAAAKNLRQRVTPTLTGSLPSGVTATLVQTSGASCGTAAQGTVDLTPGGSFATCIRVTASSSSTATSATVTLSYSGAQVRGGTVGGWTTAAKNVSVPVTITVVRPTLSCGGNQGGGDYRIDWTAVPGATSYRIYVSTSGATSGYSYYGQTGASQRSATAEVPAGWTVWVRVTAVVGGSETDPSNVLRLQRGSSSTVTCQDLG